MWNKIAGNQAPPQARQAPPQQADEEEADGEMMQSGAQDEGDEEGGDEARAAAPDAGAQGAAEGDQNGAQIDPAMQAQLFDRVKQLTKEDLQAFVAGITPPAIEVLKKVIPELSQLLDRIEQGAQQRGAPIPAPAATGGGAPMPPAAPTQAPPQPAMMQPKTNLARY